MLVLTFRTVIIFVSLLILMRLLGKRQMGELELSELIVSFLVADVAASPLQNPELELWHGLIPMVIIFLCELFISALTVKSITVRRWLCGKPCFLIVEGKIQQDSMRKCRFTVDELEEELRSKDVNDPSTVQYAILETDGTLNIILYPAERPVTAGQLELETENDGYAVVLIEDGKLLKKNLELMGKDETWLKKELKKRGCGSYKQVYTMILFHSGKIYFTEKE